MELMISVSTNLQFTLCLVWGLMYVWMGGIWDVLKDKKYVDRMVYNGIGTLLNTHHYYYYI